MFSILKKIWHFTLNTIAWVTNDWGRQRKTGLPKTDQELDLRLGSRNKFRL